ncbi:MAG: histidine triad nucleotide-binding protein [Pseudomonadota bacterium]
MSEDCLFCKIVAGDIPADVVYDSDEVLGFRDIAPQAPVHALFIPKKHISTINDATLDDAEILGQLLLAASAFSKEQGIDEPGFRVAMNCNNDGGQTVYHIHLHLLGGRQMSWPPG